MPHLCSLAAVPTQQSRSGHNNEYEFQITSYILTSTDDFFPTDRLMFGLLRVCMIVTGEIRHRDSCMHVMVAGGADAVRAMNGALVRDLIPPIQSYALRNFPLPL